jgi:hypothetical protein
LEALSHIKEAGLGNITLYPWDILTSEVRKCVPENCEFFFIDGQKSQYEKYLKKIRGIKGKKSRILLDDVVKYHSKLSTLYEYLSKMQINYQIIPTEPGDGIMILQV